MPSTYNDTINGTIPVAPSQPEIAPSKDRLAGPLGKRTIVLCLIAIGIACCATGIARILVALIGLVTNVSFFGRVSMEFSSPAGNHLGLLVIVIPAIGGLIVGLMARYGSKAIRGHGIPEAMEQVLTNGSRIPPRITLLKPLSAAIAIGTGGPFGAEGPIIATGGALGSLFGQILHTTDAERKTLLAAGAAAGMTAIFGSPVAAVLLAIELLLFEFNLGSALPVAAASIAAQVFRVALIGAGPVFAMPNIAAAPPAALCFYVVVGLVIGLVSVGVTRAVYWIEDAFEKLPIHFAWWPAIGGLAVGLIGYFAPRTLGVGYENITAALSGSITGVALLTLVLLKFVSWAVSLGSGTSGGTLAPLMTIGGGIGALLGSVAAAAFPQLGIDPHIAALVGMAGLFAGASRALLTSLVFAFKTTLQPAGLMPLFGGCVASYLVSGLMLPNTIMTEKIARRGIKVPDSYRADYLDTVRVGVGATMGNVQTLRADAQLVDVRAFLDSEAAHATHQGFPIVDADDRLVGVLTRRTLLSPRNSDSATLGSLIRVQPLTVTPEQSLREAANLMADADIGRLVVVAGDQRDRVLGIITRSDLLAAHRRRRVGEKARRHLVLRKRVAQVD